MLAAAHGVFVGDRTLGVVMTDVGHTFLIHHYLQG